MRTFSIDSENNITVIASAHEAQAGESFGSEEEWHRLTEDWPTSRLLDTWNSIPGFTPVKRFQDRKTATARIWKAIQTLEIDSVRIGPFHRKSASRTRSDSLAGVAQTRATKVVQVVALLKRPSGATLKAIMAATGWQAHSVRGFISGQLRKKMGLNVQSLERDGERVYFIRS